MLTLYRRHLARCAHKGKGRKYRHCQCPLWVAGTLKGTKLRRSLDLRSWEAGQALIREWETSGPDAVPVLVPDAVEAFLRDVSARHLTLATMRKHRQLGESLKAFAKRRGVIQVSGFTPEDLVAYRAEWTESPLTATKKLERLRSFFRFAVAMKWVPENPCAILKSPKVQQRPTLPFTPQEFERILAACDRYPRNNSRGYDNPTRMRALVLLMRYSGLRISDAVGLERSALEGGKVRLYTAKTGTHVAVPVPRVVHEALEALPGEQFFGGGSRAVSNMQRSLRRLFKLAGVPDGHSHRFRDTFAVSLLEKGVPLETVASLLGNSVKVAERHYAPWVRSRQDAMERAVRATWGS